MCLVATAMLHCREALMKIFPLLLVVLSLSLAACGRDPGPKGDSGPQGPAGPQGAPGDKGDKGDKGDAATTTLRAVQAEGSVSCETSETLVSVFCPSGGAPEGAKCGIFPTVGLCLKRP